MSHPLYKFEFNFDKERLLIEAKDPNGYVSFIDPKTGNVLDQWLIKRIDSGYGKELSDYFQLLLQTRIKPRFYNQKAGFDLPFHKDRGTQCSINFVLTGKDMISFKDFDEYYEVALLDTQTEHAVLNTTEDRLLFKLSIPDMSFKDVHDVLSSGL